MNAENIDSIIESMISILKIKYPNAVVDKNTLVYNFITAVAYDIYVDRKDIEKKEAQIFINTADAESLNKHALIFDMKKQDASYFMAQIEIKAQNNTIIPYQTILKSPSSYVYLTDVEAKVTSANKVLVNITAKTPGSTFNLQIGDKIKLSSSDARIIDTDATITKIYKIGEDQESDESFRIKLINRIRYRPRGGSKVDFTFWAMNDSAITKAFVYTLTPGEVDIYVYSDGSIITQAKLEEVKHNILYDTEGHSQIPISVQQVNVKNTNILPIYIDVINPTDKTTSTKALLKTQLDKYFLSKEPFIEGLSNENKSIITIGAINAIIYDTLQTNGISYDSILLYDNQALQNPQDRFILNIGQIAKLEEIKGFNVWLTSQSKPLGFWQH